MRTLHVVSFAADEIKSSTVSVCMVSQTSLTPSAESQLMRGSITVSQVSSAAWYTVNSNTDLMGCNLSNTYIHTAQRLLNVNHLYEAGQIIPSSSILLLGNFLSNSVHINRCLFILNRIPSPPPPPLHPTLKPYYIYARSSQRIPQMWNLKK